MRELTLTQTCLLKISMAKIRNKPLPAERYINAFTPKLRACSVREAEVREEDGDCRDEVEEYGEEVGVVGEEVGGVVAGVDAVREKHDSSSEVRMDTSSMINSEVLPYLKIQGMRRMEKKRRRKQRKRDL